MKTKLLSLFLALVASTGTIFAQNDHVKIGDLYYDLSYYTNNTPGVQKKAFVTYGPYAGLTAADIPATVTYGGMEYRVTMIKDQAFYGCSTLTSVSIPTSISSIGNTVFNGCSISDVYYEGTIEGWISKAWSTTKLFPSHLTHGKNYIVDEYISYNLHVGGELVTDLIIPNSVHELPDYIFSGCNFTSVDIPNSITDYGQCAFYQCTNLNSAIIRSSAKIGAATFGGCINLSSVNITASDINGVGYSAFEGCASLESIKINTYKDIEGEAFQGCSNLVSANLKANIIYEKAFDGCTNLKSITVAAANIKDSVFTRCASLDTIVWNSYDYTNNKYHSPFNYIDKQISSFIFGENVITIPDYLCQGMTRLTTISIPSNISTIGYKAFYGCSNLQEINVEEENNTFCSVNGVLFDKDTIALLIYPANKQDKDYSIPSSVIEIGTDAFSGNYHLSSIKFPQSIEYVSTPIFEDNSNLKSIEWDVKDYSEGSAEGIFSPISSQITSFSFGPNVEIIPSAICYNFENLEHITMYPTIKSIDYAAFAGCTKLVAFIVPDSVTFIGWSAFENCSNLTYLTLPSNLLQIGKSAFSGCTKLKSITSWAITPPQMDGIKDNSYDRIVFYGLDCTNINLYVPQESIVAYKTADQWKEFTHIYPIEYANKISTSEVTATANEDNSVTVEWPIIEDAVIYTIEIKKNGELVCTLEFNEEGQLISKVFAMPSRNGNRQTKSAAQTANGWQYTIDGLDSGTEYTYTITAKKADDTEAFTQTITFSTLSHEAIETIETNGGNMTKILHNGQIYILRGDKTYTLQGQEVK